MSGKAVTTKSATEAELKSLATVAGQAGDTRQMLLAELALGNDLDRDDYTAVDSADWAWIDTYDQESALAACVDAINDAASR